MQNITMLPITCLYPHPDNPRKNLGDLSELADSIQKNGIMQNLTVVPKGESEYTVIIGHRRLSAAKQAGLTAVPCAITEMSPTDQVATMLLENVQRVELTPFEQMKGFQQLLDLGETVETISQKTGFSASTVRRRIKLTELDEKKLAEAMTRQVSLTDLAKLEEIRNKKDRDACLAVAGTEDFERTVRAAILDQKAKDNKKPALAELDKIATKVDKRPHGYNYVGWFRFSNYEPGEFLKRLKDKKDLIYIVDKTYAEVYQKEQNPKNQTKKKTKAQLAREKDIRDRVHALEDAEERAYELRKAFVESYEVLAGKELEVLRSCARVLVKGTIYTLYIYPTDLFKFCKGLNQDGDVNEKLESLLESGEGAGLVKYIFAAFEQYDHYHKFHTIAANGYPKHNLSGRMDLLYEFLLSLGYRKNDEEEQLIKGTHPAFIFNDPESEEEQ